MTRFAVPAAIGLATIGFFTIAYGVLAVGHPHEDAFILYIFSESLADAGRIAYYEGGPLAEGATDFLWMIAISVLTLLGMSSGFGAVVLNTLGVGLAAWLVSLNMQRMAGVEARTLLIGATIVLTALALPFLQAVHAGYGGFSAPLYSAVGLLIFHILLYETRPERLLLIPSLGLLMGLFRPDGVLIGVVATFVALAIAGRENRRNFLLNMLAAGLVGIAYYVWRTWYFGEFLPLPLIVKTASDSILPGLSEIGEWAWRNKILLAVGALGATMTLRYLRAHDILASGRLPLATLPFLVHLSALAFTVQSQNVGLRFEAPQAMVLFYLSAGGLSALVARRMWFVVLPILALSMIHARTEALGLWSELRFLARDHFNVYFAQALADDVPQDTTIALTEAGMLAYWMRGRKVDLVGLNTAETARNGASPELLEELRPDMIFMHTARTVSFDCNLDICPLSADELAELAVGLPDSSTVTDRVERAPIAIYEYLIERPDEYVLFVPRINRQYVFLYAVRQDGSVTVSDFEDALRFSFTEESRLSYVESIAARAD